MRTTLTIDDDVAAKLRDELKKSGGSFKELVNDVLRTGLGARHRLQKPRKFKVRARDLGFKPGLNYDNIGELLEQIEGDRLAVLWQWTPIWPHSRLSTAQPFARPTETSPDSRDSRH
jgi:hypothetical protein